MDHTPEWLSQLADRVAAQIVAVDLAAPVGCHYALVNGRWEVTIFAGSTEVVGGPHDGRYRPSRFFLDIQGLLEYFDSIDSLAWQAQGLGAEDEVGPHLSIEGTCEGHAVWLRVPAYAPRRFPPSRRADPNRELWEEVW